MMHRIWPWLAVASIAGCSAEPGSGSACNHDHGEECQDTGSPATSDDGPRGEDSTTGSPHASTSDSGSTQATEESGGETTADEPVDFGPYPEGPYGFSVGDTFPPLTFFDAQGAEVSLQGLRDGSRRVIVLFGWAPWCGPSNVHMTDLEAAFSAIGTTHLISPIVDDLTGSLTVPSESDVAYLDLVYPNANVVADLLESIEAGTLEDEDALFVSIGELWMIDAETMQIGYADMFMPFASEVGTFLAEHDACPPKIPCEQDADCGPLGPGSEGGGFVCSAGLGLCCQPEHAFPDGECPSSYSSSIDVVPVCRFTCEDVGCL